MTTPFLDFTNCCGTLATQSSTRDNLKLATVATDTLISLTAFVLGILGLTAVITMPAAASYALIGISAGITVLWIALAIKNCFSDKKGYQP